MLNLVFKELEKIALYSSMLTYPLYLSLSLLHVYMYVYIYIYSPSPGRYPHQP